MDKRTLLIATLGSQAMRFQDLSSDFDDAAAAVLGLERADLRCISFLLSSGPTSLSAVQGALELSPRGSREMLERLTAMGYARRSTPDRVEESVDLTPQARGWVATLWGPLGEEGAEILSRHSTADLTVISEFMSKVVAIQEDHLERVRALLGAAAGDRRSNPLHGGLSPASLRRVQLYVEANLGSRLRLDGLAERAGLSTFHFARAFKASMGMTPGAYIESRRVEKARELLRTGNMPLAEISARVGFGTQSRFTSVFRKSTGMTPARYRGTVR